MEAIVIAIAASFNFLIIYWKIEKKKFTNAALDAFILFLLASMFSHSTGGMIIATISSAVVSLFLLIRDPHLPIDTPEVQSFLAEFKERLPR